MTKAKHTPGPWQYYYDQSDHFVHKVRVGAGLVCQMPGWRINSDLQNEQEANARLIAAAPKMYALLAMRAKSGDNDAVKLLQEIDDV